MGRREVFAVVCLAVLAAGALSVGTSRGAVRAEGAVIEIRPIGGTLVLIDAGPSGAPGGLLPGDLVGFVEDVAVRGIGLGDIVSFDFIHRDIPAPLDIAAALDLVSTGTVISTPQSGNIVVSPTHSVLILGAITLDGKVTLKGGTLIALGGATIDGKIEGSGGSKIIIANSVKVDGKIETVGGGLVVIKSSSVDGKISSTGSSYVQITGNTIRGKLEVISPVGECHVLGNTVDGKTAVAPTCH